MLIRKQKIPFLEMALVGMLPSFFKRAYYRMKGYSIGKNVRFGIGSVLIAKKAEIGDHCRIGHFTVLRASSVSIGRFTTIGSFSFLDSGRLTIGEDARINEQVIVGGMKTPESELRLGSRTIIMEYSFVNTTCPVTIGDDSGVGGHCLLFTHGSWLNQLEGYPVNFAPITIGKSVWLPWRVFVMPGSEIGDGSVIAACSMVNGKVAPHSLAAGTPAKTIRSGYPETPDAARKKQLFRDCIEDFRKYLAHEGFELSVVQNEQSTVLSSLHPLPFRCLICEDPLVAPAGERYDAVAFNVGALNSQMPVVAEAGTMYLDIGRKQRKGASRGGEELAKFLGRYGLRFQRLD